MQQKSAGFLGKKVNYYTAGSGSNHLVLLHGFLENSFMWQEYIERWKKDFSIIAIDIPGQGLSDVLHEVHTTSLMADAVDAVLKNENVKYVSFIGHSMGGYVALAFGERYGEKTKGVVLLNSTAVADSEIKKADRERAIKVMLKNPSIFINESIPNLFANHHREKFKTEIQHVIQEALKTSVVGACSCLRGMKAREDKTHLLRDFTFPIHFVSGEKDNVIPIEKIREQASLNKNIQLIIFPESGHMSFIEEKKACYENITSLIHKIIL